MNKNFLQVLARSSAVWLIIICAETLNGTLRELFIKPLVGDARARQISFLIALALISLIAFIFIRWIKAESNLNLFFVGIWWALLTFCFELFIACAVMKFSWEKFFADYNFFQGGLMLFGLLYLIFAPLGASKLQDKQT